MKLLQQCFLFFIVVVIPGHNLGNSQVSVNRTIGPTLVFLIWQFFTSEKTKKVKNKIVIFFIKCKNLGQRIRKPRNKKKKIALVKCAKYWCTVSRSSEACPGTCFV